MDAGASGKRYRATCLSQRIQRHVADAELRLKRVDRYGRRPEVGQAGFKDAVSSVLHDEALDELTASYLITALGATDCAGLALVTADWLAQTRPNLGCTASVIDAALRAASTSVLDSGIALKLLERRSTVGLKPTVHAANLAITACSHGGDIEHAMEILEGMAKTGLQPNEYSLIMVLQAANFKSKGRYKEAMRAIATWRHGPILPSSVVESLLTVFESAIRKAPSVEEAEAIFADLKSIGYHDATRAYNAVLSVCANRGDWERARMIFESMVAEDVPADAHTFNALLKACVKGGSLQAALDIYEWMVAGREVSSPIPADIETYNILIKACHQAGYLEKALEISNWAMSTGQDFNSTTYRELIETIEIAQIWDQKSLKDFNNTSFSQATPRNCDSLVKKNSLPSGELLLPSPRNRKASMAVPLAILPHHLRPAPHDGLRVLYLDHLENLQQESLLAASKLRKPSWATALMQGGHDSSGVASNALKPSSLTVSAAMAGTGIFSSSFQSTTTTKYPVHAAKPMTPLNLSRVPSVLANDSDDN